jgi:hypothetical protein
MNVEIDTGSEYKAVVTFASRKEHDRFCSDAPAWSRLHYRWTGNDNPFPESIFMVVDRLIGGKVPETFPHEEVVTDRSLISGTNLPFYSSRNSLSSPAALNTDIGLS